MQYKNILISAFLIGVILFPSYSFAANERFEMGKIRRDTEKQVTTLSGSLSSVIAKAPRETRGIYNSMIQDRFKQIQSSMLYSYFLSDIQDDRLFVDRVIEDINALKKEIAENPLKKTVTQAEKTKIESEILSHQKAFFEPISTVVLPKLTKSLKQKGNMKLAIETKLGRMNIELKDYIYRGNQSTGNFDLSTTIAIDVDMTLSPKQNCEYDIDFNYICKEPTSATGKLVFQVSAPIHMIKEDSTLYFQAGKLDAKISDLPDASGTTLMSEISTSIQEYNTKYAGKSYKLTVPREFEMNQDLIQQQIDTIQLLLSTSILTPTYKNSDTYLLDWNPLFTKKLRSIFGVNFSTKSIAQENIRYTGGKISFRDWTGYDNGIDTMYIAVENSIPTIRFDSWGKGYGKTFVGSGLMQPTRIALNTAETGDYSWSRMSLDWNNKNLYAQYVSDSLDWTKDTFLNPSDIVSESEKNKGFEIGGTLSWTDMDIVATYYTRRIGHISARSLGNLLSIDANLSISAIKVRLSSLIEEVFEDYIPNLPSNAIDLDSDEAPLDDLLDLSDTLTKQL